MITILMLTNQRDKKLMGLCPNHDLQVLEKC